MQKLSIQTHHMGGAGALGEIGWHVMHITEDISRTVPSKLADLRDVPLAEMPTLSAVTLDEAFDGIMPGSKAVPVPVMAFASAI